jgi:hypothetical protein
MPILCAGENHQTDLTASRPEQIDEAFSPGPPYRLVQPRRRVERIPGRRPDYSTLRSHHLRSNWRSPFTYLTTCSREDENLPIIRGVVNWLQLRYNIVVSIVRSDSKMNCNKTKEWFNRRGMSFERCAPDTKRHRTGRRGNNGESQSHETLVGSPTLCSERLYPQQHTSTTEHLDIHWDGRARTRSFTTMYDISRGDGPAEA